MIFFRRGPKSDAEGAPKYEYEEAINFAVFPSLQGGPHNHQIAGLCTQLKEVATPEFKAYAKQIRANAQALAKFLIGKGYKLTTEGTENHLMLWDLRPLGLTGSKVEKVFEMAHITLGEEANAAKINALKARSRAGRASSSCPATRVLHARATRGGCDPVPRRKLMCKVTHYTVELSRCQHRATPNY